MMMIAVLFLLQIFFRYLEILSEYLTVLQLNFLVQKEILSAKSTRLRADVLAHFIKVTKVRFHLLSETCRTCSVKSSVYDYRVASVTRT